MRFDPVRVPVGRVFDVSLLLVFVVHIDHSKPDAVAISPLEVVHDRPSKVAFHIYSILFNGQLHILDVISVVLKSEVIMDSLINR